MKSFEDYDRENPQVWIKFRNLALETIQRGFKHYSAKGIFELIRWHTGVLTTGDFKLNNNYSADYARRFLEEYPEHKGFFRTRVRTKGEGPTHEKEPTGTSHFY